MHKTLSITIGNELFTVREDAYHVLSDYLREVESTFSGNPDGKDILMDIEERMAELLKNALKSTTSVIDTEMVASVIETIGHPKDLDATDEDAQVPHAPKQLYRDSSHAVVAGVCAGLGNYLAVDPLMIRLIFALAVVTGAFAAPVIITYIVMWAVVPEAKTLSERMAMRGEPATLAHIGERLNASMERGARKLRENMDTDNEDVVGKITSGLNAMFNVLGMAFWKIVAALRWLGRILALVVASAVMAASVIGTAMTTFLLTLLVVYPGSEVVDFPLEVIGYCVEYYLLVCAAFFAVTIPLVVVFLLALSILRRRNAMSVASSISLLFLWIICAGIAIATAVHVLPEVRAAFTNSKDAASTSLGAMAHTEKRLTFTSTDAVWVRSGIEADIVLGDVNEVILRGRQKDVEEIILEDVGDGLSLRRDRYFIFCIFCVRDDVQATIVVTEWPTDYRVSGASRLEAKDVDIASANLGASGASHLAISGTFTEVIAELSGASHLVIDGDAGDTIDAELSGASQLDAMGFNVRAARFAVSGASDVRTSVEESIVGTLSGASRVVYKGDPTIDVDTSGSSQLRQLLVTGTDTQTAEAE